MLESLRNRRNRKGFTLAELLIVVAIIAVLVAIAVPLFVTGLQKAQRARDDANARAVKSAAVVYILEAPTNDKNIYNVKEDGTGSGEFYKNFEVVASVDQSGKIDLTTIKGQDAAFTTGELDRDWYKIAPANNGWTITVYISSTDLDLDLTVTP